MAPNTFQISGIASGLSYLHQNSVVHSDMKAVGVSILQLTGCEQQTVFLIV